MTNKSFQFESVATRLLLAIYGGGRKRASLEDLLGDSDYLEHGIVSFESLQSGLSKLTFAGHVREKDGIFSLSEEATAACERVMRSNPGRQEWFSGTQRFLDASAKKYGHAVRPPSSWTYPRVTRAAYERAYSLYYERMQDYISKMSGEGKSDED